MAVENELIYIVRLNAEGEQEVVKARRVIDETGDAAQKSEKKVGSLGKGMKNAGQSSTDYKKRQSAANNAMLDVTRIAQDAQYGIRGVANNLEQAALSSTRLFEKSGSVTDALKSMGSSLTGVGGVVAGVTAFNLIISAAQSGLFSFGEEVKDFAKDSEKMIEKLRSINEELNQLKGFDDGGFFSTKGDYESLRRLSVAEEDIKDNIKELENYQNAIKLTKKEIDEARHSGRLNVGRQGEIESVDLTEDQLQRLEQQRQYLEDIGKEIDKVRSKIERTENIESDIPTFAAAETERMLADADKKWKEMEKEFEDFGPEDVETPLITDDSTEKKMKERMKQEAKQMEKIGQQRIQFEKKLQQMRIDAVRSGGNKVEALKMEEQMRIEQIQNNEVLTARQKEQAITNIKKKYANERSRIEEQNANKQQQIWENAQNQVLQLEQSVAQQRQQVIQMGLNAASSLYQAFAEDNEGIAIGLLALEKGLQIARVVADTTRKAAQATMTGMTLLANPATAPLAANAFAQAGAIKSTGAAAVGAILAQGIGEGAQILQGGGGSGGGNAASSVGYRGMSFSSPTSQAGNTSGRPGGGTDGSRQRANDDEKKVIFIDDLGNMVSKGREKIERGGGDNYMRTGA